MASFVWRRIRRVAACVALSVALCVSWGCGEEPPSPTDAESPTENASLNGDSDSSVAESSREFDFPQFDADPQNTEPSSLPQPVAPRAEETPTIAVPDSPPASFSTSPPVSPRQELPRDPVALAPPRKPSIDEARAAEAGIRKYAGRHVTIYSDADPESVRALPAAFDAAVAEWAKYFKVSAVEKSGQPWRVDAHLLANAASEDRFRRVGLWRAGLPRFRNGFAFSDAVFLRDQQSDYYRRHLLLHEGVHAFMLSRFGSCGPAWYMEGVAELLGTVGVQDGKLITPYFPRTREEVPLWGRIRIVKDLYAEGKGRDVESV
ncbi:MAG: hypothetical protein N2C14_14680, partial [Planctomycetales bacterium]